METLVHSEAPLSESISVESLRSFLRCMVPMRAVLVPSKKGRMDSSFCRTFSFSFCPPSSSETMGSMIIMA